MRYDSSSGSAWLIIDPWGMKAQQASGNAYPQRNDQTSMTGAPSQHQGNPIAAQDQRNANWFKKA